ncbi:Putative uncharacterized protein [Thermobacillus xylanilyticus]|jgi:hypothetical protein|uniref:Uncharacterized protein n=1 Tax=Thermobacillus xylanilyticus TaxID=76633 RepID=A0ABM8V173_THEXY|nr:MAG: hypothetical protein C6W59_16520 [Paenibacillaceae bacterium]CAG5080310.1 Putative uncharacterized protein [Thermobacillus xylanilyticus]
MQLKIREGVSGLKTVIQSLLISLVIHAIFIAGALAVAWLQTRDYKPEIASRYENFEPLQQKAAIVGIVASPLWLLCTFVGTAAVSGIIIRVWKKNRKPKASAS